MAEFTIRPFQAKDVFKAVRILSKVGLKEFKGLLDPENLQALMTGAGEDANDPDYERNVGIGIVLEALDILLTNVGKIEKDLYDWLGDLSGTEDVASLPAGEFVQLLEAVVESDGFTDFFKEVSGWFARMQASSSSRFTVISTTQEAC